jgi:hypothetical protein
MGNRRNYDERIRRPRFRPLVSESKNINELEGTLIIEAQSEQSLPYEDTYRY